MVFVCGSGVASAPALEEEFSAPESACPFSRLLSLPTGQEDSDDSGAGGSGAGRATAAPSGVVGGGADFTGESCFKRLLSTTTTTCSGGTLFNGMSNGGTAAGRATAGVVVVVVGRAAAVAAGALTVADSCLGRMGMSGGATLLRGRSDLKAAGDDDDLPTAAEVLDVVTVGGSERWKPAPPEQFFPPPLLLTLLLTLVMLLALVAADATAAGVRWLLPAPNGLVGYELYSEPNNSGCRLVMSGHKLAGYGGSELRLNVGVAKLAGVPDLSTPD